MTDGTGVRTVRNIQCTHTKRPQRNRPQTSASSAKQRKKTGIANLQSIKNTFQCLSQEDEVMIVTYCTHCGKELSGNSKPCTNCKASSMQVDGLNGTAAENILSESALQQHWVKRVIAIAIDSVIVVIATAILGLATDLSGILNLMSLPFVMGLIYVLYFTLTESFYSYTMGKKLVNLKVTSANGKKPSLKNAFIRNISKIHFLLLFLDTLGGFFTSKDNHQRYIDQIANTTVV